MSRYVHSWLDSIETKILSEFKGESSLELGGGGATVHRRRTVELILESGLSARGRSTALCRC